MSLRYALGRLVFKFHENRISDDVIVTSKFLETIVYISISIEPTNFVLETNTQKYNFHLIIKMKATLTDDEGHRRRSNVIKMK